MRGLVIYLTENEVVTMNEKSHLPAPPAGAPTPENVNPAPDRISPEKPEKQPYLPFVRKRK